MKLPDKSQGPQSCTFDKGQITSRWFYDKQLEDLCSRRFTLSCPRHLLPAWENLCLVISLYSSQMYLREPTRITKEFHEILYELKNIVHKLDSVHLY